jgi:hypothetical protein
MLDVEWRGMSMSASSMLALVGDDGDHGDHAPSSQVRTQMSEPRRRLCLPFPPSSPALPYPFFSSFPPYNSGSLKLTRPYGISLCLIGTCIGRNNVILPISTLTQWKLKAPSIRTRQHKMMPWVGRDSKPSLLCCVLDHQHVAR